MAQMTQERLDAIKATFPWTKHIRQLDGRIGGIVQVIDRNGNEVPIFDMTDFLEVLTLKMAQQRSPEPEQTE